MKLSKNISYIIKVAKNLKIGTNSLKIKAKKEDCITINVKNIIPLF